MLSSDDVITVPDRALTDHPNYGYTVAAAHGAGGFVVATTDSRVDIGGVPLYSTTVSEAGVYGGHDTRLTFAGEHDDLDLAFDGAAFGLAYDEHLGEGSQVYLRQLDASGADLFGAYPVSDATYLEFGCCTERGR